MGRLVWGIHPVSEALRAGRVQALFVAEGETGVALRGLREAARAAKVDAEERARGALDELAKGAVHQGAVAVVGEYPYASLEEILALAKRGPAPALVLVLDGVQDPQRSE